MALEGGPTTSGFRVRCGDSCPCFLESPITGVAIPPSDFQHGFIVAI